ncbi:hypothetical protein [Micromonospora sp. NPDC048947]|uniref:hypothetical protein n=1 Tax=Micromonospora sp. NPDC048947 TaxID=3154826 RepID=UPI0033DF1B6F
MDRSRLPDGLVRTVDASVYLKSGESAVEGHGTELPVRQTGGILAQVEIVAGFRDSYVTGARQSLSRRDARR